MSTWYRAGTVDVENGSPVITGTGTSWLTQTSQGDVFTLDGDKFYEVGVVNSDEQITLTENYAETTLTGQAYAIIRNFTSTTNALLAAKLSALLNRWQLREDEMLAWLSGPGTVTITDDVGVEHVVKTPQQIQNEWVGSVSVAVTTADVTLTSEQSGNAFVNLSGTLTGDRSVIVPTSQSHLWLVSNGTSGSYEVTVKTVSGTGIVVPSGQRMLLYCDGTNVVQAQQVPQRISVKDFPFLCAGKGGNETAKVQAAADLVHAMGGGDLYFPDGNYGLTTVNLYTDVSPVGATKKGSIITSLGSGFVFEYLSPLTGNVEVDMDFHVRRLTFQVQNGIRLNQSGDFTTVFSAQASLLGPRITDCIFDGTYSLAGDANAQTAIVPTTADLLAFGTAIYMSRVFNAEITRNKFIRNGIGIYTDGCDINRIHDNRFFNNARHWHNYGHNAFGSQNLFEHNDVLRNYRVYGIYDESGNATSYVDNYFETPLLSGNYLKIDLGQNHVIDRNRFAANGTATPIMTLGPRFGTIVCHNRMDLQTPLPTIEVLTTGWDPTFSGLKNPSFVKFVDNATTFQLPAAANCVYDTNNPRVFDAFNPKVVSGLKATSGYIWSASAVTGTQCVTGSPSSLIVKMDTTESDLNLLVAISGLSLTGTSSVVEIKWGGTVVFAAANWGHTSTTGLQTLFKTIRKPDAVAANSGLQFEIVTTTLELHRIEVTPVDYEILSAAPTTNTYVVGARVIQRVPAVGQPKGWRCTVAGTPGTWVSEGNL